MDSLNQQETYQTVRIEFTYFGKNLHRFSDCNLNSSSNEGEDIGMFSSTVSQSSCEPSFESLKDDEVLDPYREDKPIYLYSRDHITDQDKTDAIQLINANLAHFQCPDVMHIGEDITLDERANSSEDNLILPITRTATQPLMFKDRPNPRDTKPKSWKNPLKTKSPVVDVIPFRLEKPLLGTFLTPITVDIPFRVLGHILERERFVRICRLKPMARKKMFLTNKRINDIKQKLNMLEIPVGPKKTKQKHPMKEQEIADMFLKYTDRVGLRRFAELVLGITDSQELYRTLLKYEQYLPVKTPVIERPCEATQPTIVRNKDNKTSISSKPAFDSSKLNRNYSEIFYMNKYKSTADDQREQERLVADKGNRKLLLTDFTTPKLNISCQKLLESLENFVVRRERLCASNQFKTMTTLVFIKPSLFSKTYFH